MLISLISAPPTPPEQHSLITDPTFLGWVTVISLIITVISIAVAYYFYRKSKNWHLVLYEVLSDTPIVRVHEQTGRGKIKLTYENLAGHSEEITDARLVTLKVWNTGNGDVLIWSAEDKVKADLEVPIQFGFSGRTLVGLTHVETDPPNGVIRKEDLDAYLDSVSPASSALGLPRCILKQSQSIQLGILLNGPSGKVELNEYKLLNGDVLDVLSLQPRKLILQMALLFVPPLAIVIITTVIANQFLPKESNTTLNIASQFVLLFILIISGIYIVWVSFTKISKFMQRSN